MIRRNLRAEKEKYRRFQQKNCDRARRRGGVSYETLIIIYKQLFEINKFGEFIREQISDYKRFLVIIKDFLSENSVCKTNLQWNKMMIEVRLHKIYSSYF